MKWKALSILIVLILCSASPAEPTTRATQPAAQSAQIDVVETHHELRLDDTLLTYKAMAGKLPLTNDAGKKQAEVFFVAYERTGEGIDRTRRPLTFVFNGGPGAAAVWLHLGTAGPRVIDLPPDGDAPPPPYRLVDNDATWLTATDLVFIDPVGTGFSRAAEGVKAEQFYGVREDIRAVGAFIRLYTTRYGRFPSPKFLAGESYGTTRAAGLANHLLDEEGIALNGIIFISTVLDFATLRPSENNNLPYVFYLPSYAAVAYHHKRLSKDLQDRPLAELLDEVRQFAIERYLPAIAQGADLAPDRRAEMIERLTAYTGLPSDYIDRADLRIAPGGFMSQLLKDQRRLIGRFDGRLSGFDPNPLSPVAGYDPSLSRFLPIYTTTFNDYVRSQLGFETDLKYEVLSGLVHPWNFGPGGQGFTNTADDLASAMAKNPAMRALFASGYEDLATPFFATDYTIAQLKLGPELRRNIVHRYYVGGHMLYHVAESRRALGRDIERFIRESVSGKAD